MKNQKLKITGTLLVLVFCGFWFFYYPAFAQTGGLVPCGRMGQNPCTFTDIFVLIARVTNWLIAIAGVYAVYQLVSCGFWLVVSMGNEESITKYRSGITNAVVGFVVVMFAYMMVNTVTNYILTGQQCEFNLSNPLNYLTINKNASQCTPKINK